MIPEFPIPIKIKQYKALATQTGTDPLVLTELLNTYGKPAVSTRTVSKDYNITIQGLLTEGKTICPPFGNFVGTGIAFIPISDWSAILGYYSISPQIGANDRIQINFFDPTFNVVDMNTIMGTSSLYFEINTY